MRRFWKFEKTILNFHCDKTWKCHWNIALGQYRYRRNYYIFFLFIAHWSIIKRFAITLICIFLIKYNSTPSFCDLLKHYKYFVVCTNHRLWFEYQERRQNYWFALITKIIKKLVIEKISILHGQEPSRNFICAFSTILWEHGRPKLKVKKLEDL